MSHESLAYTAAGIALLGTMAYAILGGADFGGGIWDLFATGPRKHQQRVAIARAMGPVWEANHVWFIFVLVVLFTCFPYAYAPLSVALFVPLHLALVGIVLRGAAFIFRGYERKEIKISTWRLMFGVASVITPVLLGMAFGAVTAGGVEVTMGQKVIVQAWPPYLRPYSIGCGLLALSACAYLAAVYLTVETDAALREDFRRRAIVAGTTTFVLAIIVLVLAWWEARWFFDQLTSVQALPATVAGVLSFAASAWAVFGRRYKLARVFAAGEIVLLLLGWGLAQYPYLAYPSMKIADVAGPAATIRLLLLSLPVGAALLVPSLWLMFRVFKADDTIG